MPVEAAHENYTILQDLIVQYDPDIVYILGDLFHSKRNSDWDIFNEFLSEFPGTIFTLILGNHDILSDEDYALSVLNVHKEPFLLNPFMLSHHPMNSPDLYNLCGHIHPSVSLRGRGRQRLKLPCFFFNDYQGIIPAFGNFTGTHTLKATKKDLVYAIAEGQVIKIEQ